MKKQIIGITAVFALILLAFSVLAAAPTVVLTDPDDSATDTDGDDREGEP